MRYIIIGSGVAGFSAIEAIRSVDVAGEIVMISDDAYGYYSRPGLAYYLTGELPDKALYPRMRDDYKRLDFKFINARATRILRGEHTVELDGKLRLNYDKLLIAVGAGALPLGVPNSNLEGVVKLDNFADANKIIRLAKRGKTAVVVGGGITALELTEGLLARGMKVYYLLRGDRYWSNVLDESESKTVQGLLQAEGVELRFHAALREIIGKKNRVAAVRLENGQTIKCDLLACAIGIRPRLELVQDIGLNLDRGILTDERLQTNDPDIFAAGDAAQVFDPLSDRAILDSLWNPAREQGRAAGLNMAGRKTVYLKSPPFNVTRLAGLTTTIIGMVGRGRDDDVFGIVRGDSETWRSLPDVMAAQSGFEVNRLRLILGEEKLLGAVAMGDQTLSLPLQKMIAGGADISSIRDKLLAPNAPIAELIADFWTAWRRQTAF